MPTIDVITDLVSRSESFTAFEVTTELRRSGEFAKHGAVRKAVQDAYASGDMPGYDRTQVSTPNWAAFLYHPSSVDPHAYATKYGAVPPPLPSVPSVPPTVSAPSSDSVVRGTDGDGRLFVPPRYLATLGIAPGGGASFVANPGELIILPGGSDLYRHGRGHFRINPRTLAKAGIAGKSSYQITLSTGSISIKA